MVLIDNALQARERNGNPIKVGVFGAGEMAKGIINQITRYTPGMEVAAVYNRTPDKAWKAYATAGIDEVREVSTVAALQDSIAAGGYAITSDPYLLCEAEGLDIVLEVTGTIDFAARVILKAIEHGKHVLSFNAEIDATLGPILKHYADQAGVIYSVSDGDQPGVTMNLYRYVQGMGFRPLLCGNIKGLQDRYRNPTTQQSFAKQWGMAPEMVTSFADGTKISFEQACIANATGMQVAVRGMYGYHSKEHVDDLTHLYDVAELERLGGIVDYVVGPKPAPGVFIYATTDDPLSVKYLKYGKLGEGPLYSFYHPYHLLFFEIASSIARVVDFKDIIIAPKAGPVVEVITSAKRDLKAGHTLDGLGGYDTYGMCENTPVVKAENLLPMGLAEGTTLKRDIPRDGVISFDDVVFPADNLPLRLYQEQNQLFSVAPDLVH
jgi:predicted homoserine dehydrogenase-like protein